MNIRIILHLFRMVGDSLCRSGVTFGWGLASSRVMMYDPGRRCPAPRTHLRARESLSTSRIPATKQQSNQLEWRQNKRYLQLNEPQLNGARSSKKQRSEERVSLQAALSVAAEGDLDLRLPANNESSSQDECETRSFNGRLIGFAQARFGAH